MKIQICQLLEDMIRRYDKLRQIYAYQFKPNVEMRTIFHATQIYKFISENLN